MKRIFELVLLLSFSLVLVSEQSFIPDPPKIGAKNFILIDSITGKVLAQQSPDGKVEPASITKIMTGYVVADQIKQGFISENDEVLISENCWRKGGSRMFIEAGKRVLVSDLIKGMVVQSGNDASCALAEHVAVSEEGFVDLMSRYIYDMGLKNTNFVNVTGWPDENHYSSARDIAILSKRLIEDFPAHYDIYKEKFFTFNDIKQRNRNSLLWQDETIDGLKTGHTESAGYCLVSSGVRNETRLIAVTLGSSSEKQRIVDNRRLLDYGFRYFRTKKVLSSMELLAEEQVWGGEKESLSLLSSQDVYFTLPLRDFQNIKSNIVLDDYLQAPIAKDQKVGKLEFSLNNKVIKSIDIVSSEEVDSLGVFGQAWSNIKLFVYQFLMEED
ncbi:MAG: D-alanyl-D-alanine carboxypeptidase family protein [Pseudomonadota bacterium]|jgi:D-alanyl-D-alanine carboxypeptidase (penicillin-binding protein 5/6)|nr:D-alanyl-D-alanine carboxypeptidase family protein [Pseudomonadota bacterium]